MAAIELRVDRAAGLAALRRLTESVERPVRETVIIGFDAGFVIVRLAGRVASAPAEGRWPGEARVDGAFVLALAATDEGDAPIELRVAADRIWCGGLSAPCHWQRAGLTQVTLPPNATTPQILHAAAGHGDDVLEQSGVLRAVEAARSELDFAVYHAAHYLAGVGIREDDLRRFLTDCFRDGRFSPVIDVDDDWEPL